MKSHLKNESGMSMVESMIAVLVLLVGLLMMAQVIAFCVVTSKTLGKDAGKITAAARDKMEELTALAYTDTTSDVAVYPNTPAGGQGLTHGGAVYPADPAAGYHDHLNAAGARTTSDASSVYTRQWAIVDDASGKIKKIIVSVVGNKSLQVGTTPSTTLISYKASSAPTVGY